MPEVIHPPDEHSLIHRAALAYGRPSVVVKDATVQHLAGRDYVILPRHLDWPIVYRVRPDRSLRQMIKPPPELTRGYEDA